MIILASASPRRKDILKTAGYDFKVCPMDIDEENITADAKEELVMKLAAAKAHACKENPDLKSADQDYIVGADTLVFADGQRLGKPADKDQWREYIKLLSGNVHEVITGVCILHKGEEKCFYSSTKVYVAQMSAAQIEDFIARNEDMDKAGGYAIQGYFAKYIHKIEGEYNNVVGFPIAKFHKVMTDLT